VTQSFTKGVDGRPNIVSEGNSSPWCSPNEDSNWQAGGVCELDAADGVVVKSGGIMTLESKASLALEEVVRSTGIPTTDAAGSGL
jgi:hypothetical protein